MAAGSDDSGAPYADAISNIRDTIKWLAASFASIAAVVIANTPFSNIGSLDVYQGRFQIAVAALLLAFICVVVGLYRILALLAPDDLYATDLAVPSRSGRTLKDQEELSSLRNEINAHAWELLPANYPTLEALVEATRREEDALKVLASQNRQVEFEGSQQRLQLFNTVLGRLLGFAVYKRLYGRLSGEVRFLFFLGVGALLTLLAFAWAANPPKESANPPANYFVIDRDAATGPAPVSSADLDPVLFALGSAETTGDALVAIEKAREFLRNDPHAALLLRAHTDTLASDSINRSLARRRSEAVRRLLIGSGSIAPNRIFVAELPKKEVPNITKRETADDRNRSVEFLVAWPVPASRE